MTANPQRILIIEDERALRRSMEYRLQKEGYAVVTAQNGEEGLARAAEERPDLVLLDLILPKLNGFEILRRFKADPALQDVPAVIFTNLSQETDRNQAEALGAAGFFVKSDLPIDQVVEQVRKFLAS